MDGEFLILAAYLFLLFLILAAFVVVWCELFEPPYPEMIADNRPWKPSGSYWTDCMRRGDCYKSAPQKTGAESGDKNDIQP